MKCLAISETKLLAVRQAYFCIFTDRDCLIEIKMPNNAIENFFFL